MDDPSRILAQARQQLEALKQAGLSRSDLLALLEEEPQQSQQTQQSHQSQQSQQPQQPQQPQQQQQQQQQHQHMTPVTPVTPDASTFQNFNYHDINAGFKPPPQYRASVSTVSSSSSRDSCFSATSARSSVSSTSNPASESKFWCTSCNKTFKRKFDWKRHEEEFHDRSRKYPCDSCNQSFWGPNTFNQHHKSAHGCQTCPHADMVMRPMKKRRAYGCGFCAALHGQFERHIDHVATHFEGGMTKRDWSHSNVIYGLLHQHGIIEAWKALVASKHNQFNDRQPMFGWSPESTGRAHGFVENENPGQLQDLLEFFDGSKESAKKIVQLAETCVHVVLRPKSPPSSPTASADVILPLSGATGGSPRVSRAMVREPRRSTSMSAMVKAAKPGRRAVSSSSSPFESQAPNTALTPVPSMTLPSSSPATPAPPHQPLAPATNTVYSNFIPAPSTTAAHAHGLTPIQTHAGTYTDKALPPPPLDPVSPMAVDFPSFAEPQHHHHQQQQQQHHHMVPQQQQAQPAPTQSFLPEVDFVSDWQSFTSTLMGDDQQQAMTTFAAHGFPMSWDDLGQYSGTPGR
ncbi:hypothetical protein F4861DRAFT_327687 [Xylaria intraflava]|nr:hypothetical protein F4861DRAFT_327687 [Xylaria intraflava]